MSDFLPGMEPPDAEWVPEMSLTERVNRAIELLRANEPEEGYWLAFSGGKDSCIDKKLAQMAGVKFDAHYNNTTIDPPELVRFIKKEHPDVIWENPALPMMMRVAQKPMLAPTRQWRWCCDEYKERGGRGRVKIFGVRKAESSARARRWTEVAEMRGQVVICPIVHWSDDQVWEFLRHYKVPYCSLYDEGWTRLGCVGCPLAKRENQDREFARWPKYEENWKKAVTANWERYHNKIKRDGQPYTHSKFASAEEYWRWWRYAEKPRLNGEECQTGLLWTNAEA